LLRPWPTAAPENGRSESGPRLSAGRPGRGGVLLCAVSADRRRARRAARMPARRPARAPSPQAPRQERSKRHPGRPALIQHLRSARPATPTEPAIPPRSLRSAAGNLAHPPQPSDPVHSSAWLPARARAVLLGQRRPAGRPPRSRPRVPRARTRRRQHQRCDDLGVTGTPGDILAAWPSSARQAPTPSTSTCTTSRTPATSGSLTAKSSRRSPRFSTERAGPRPRRLLPGLA
jgi:hypothetical protein